LLRRHNAVVIEGRTAPGGETNEATMPASRTWGLVAYLIVYPLIHVPLLLLCIWPLIAGMRYHWGPMTFGLWILWCVPFAFIAVRMDRWQWWRQIRKNVKAWAD
jgi:hypothetical protein